MSILNRLIRRRNALKFLGTTTIALLVSCLPKKNTVAQSSSCIVRPEQAEGPYFVDEKLNRSDIRSDSKSGAVKAGIPLRLKLRVTQIGDSSCTPIQGAIVDIWHCDATGAYSNVRDTTGQNFLRGYQTTDSSGMVEFLTIYPGWYPGRTVHIHFKVRNANQEFTSQLYFEDALTDQVHAQSPYTSKGQRTVRNDRDGIFQDGGNELLLSPVKTNQGYAAAFEVGLQAT